jgi:phage repressor protein C with HTH and peptisase S24 domain
VAVGEIGRRIKEVRETYKGVGMRQGVLAKLIGVSQSRLSGWEQGKHDPYPIGIVNVIAKHLETTPDYLLHGRRPYAPVAEATGKIKIYGAASAGRGNASSVDGQELDVPIEFARPDYGGLIVEGDSMMPFLHPGDIAIFRDHPEPKPNAIVAAEIPGGEWVIKKAVHTGERYALRSLNPAYEDIKGRFRVYGFLVGFVRDDGPERLIRLNPYGLKDSTS